jgi:hypothetical protein
MDTGEELIDDFGIDFDQGSQGFTITIINDINSLEVSSFRNFNRLLQDSF